MLTGHNCIPDGVGTSCTLQENEAECWRIPPLILRQRSSTIADRKSTSSGGLQQQSRRFATILAVKCADALSMRHYPLPGSRTLSGPTREPGLLQMCVLCWAVYPLQPAIRNECWGDAHSRLVLRIAQTGTAGDGVSQGGPLR